MKSINLVLAIISLGIISSCSTFLKEDTSISSPDGKTNVELNIKDGKLFYEVYRNGVKVIDQSGMGYQLADDINLTRNFEIADVIKTSFKKTWKPVWGENATIENEYKEMLVRLSQSDSSSYKLNIYFRVFNDGVAFRYVIPHQSNLSDVVVLSEESQFNFTANHTAWWIPGNFDSYEFLYTKSTFDEIESVNTPFTIKANDSLYVAIHEAHLENYSGMTLHKSSKMLFGFESNLVPWSDGTKVKGILPFVSPWRTIQISNSAAKLIESNMIVNLNPPCKLEKTDWIEPMKYMGVWWGMHIGYETWTEGRRHGATTRNIKKYIDFAAENNIRGVLAEGWNSGWDKWGQPKAFDQVTPAKDFNLTEVAAYAQDKGVAFIGHHETGGDAAYYEELMDSAFALYQSLGIKAVKTGYAGAIRPSGEYHHGQYMVNHYRKVVEKAAQYGLMIDAHEPIKPTGERRTYPNMMTREGVRGMEWNAWSTGNPPDHTTIIPFTRMLAGPIDYTPGIFDLLLKNHEKELFDWNSKPKEGVRVHTTLAKQLALFVVLYSPLQMASDLVDNYTDTLAFKFISDVATNWDESRVVNGEIGEYVTIARKNNDDWFIGGISNEQGRELKIPLNFLDKNQQYTATIYADTDSTNWKTAPTYYQVNDTVLNADDTWVMKLAPGGGQAIKLSKK